MTDLAEIPTFPHASVAAELAEKHRMLAALARDYPLLEAEWTQRLGKLKNWSLVHSAVTAEEVLQFFEALRAIDPANQGEVRIEDGMVEWRFERVTRETRHLGRPLSNKSVRALLMSIKPGERMRFEHPASTYMKQHLLIARRGTAKTKGVPRLAVVNRNYDEGWCEVENVPEGQPMPSQERRRKYPIDDLDPGEEFAIDGLSDAALASLRAFASSKASSQRYFTVKSDRRIGRAVVTCHARTDAPDQPAPSEVVIHPKRKVGSTS